MPPNNPSPSEEEVLLAFAVEPKRDRATLERYLAEYPEYASALVDCALEIVTLPTEISPVTVAESEVEAAWQKFRTDLAPTSKTAEESPFAKLTPTAFRNLAAQLGINNLLLVRIRDRGIRAASIPVAFVRQLAGELKSPFDVVAGYLERPPSLAAASAFRSAGKPTATSQVEFADAVKSSQLSPEQQKRLLTLGG